MLRRKVEDGLLLRVDIGMKQNLVRNGFNLCRTEKLLHLFDIEVAYTNAPARSILVHFICSAVKVYALREAILNNLFHLLPGGGDIRHGKAWGMDEVQVHIRDTKLKRNYLSICVHLHLIYRYVRSQRCFESRSVYRLDQTTSS